MLVARSKIRLVKAYTNRCRSSSRQSWLAKRMPAMMVIDKTGEIIYVHYADSMKDIPANSEVLAVLDERNQELAAAFGAPLAPERAGQSTQAIVQN